MLKEAEIAVPLQNSALPHQPTAKELSDARARSRVLVVDDSEMNRRLLAIQLEHLGYPCDQVASGALAIDALRHNSYAIILMDIEMPEMDGYQATERIRALACLARDPVVIAVTAHTVEESRAKCMAAGLDDYISKPVRLQQLGELLDRWAKSGRAQSWKQPEVT